jgi:putative toxin-antitoxin system antitoxin component (TIGR02293 family)
MGLRSSATRRALAFDFETLISADSMVRLEAVRNGLQPAVLDQAAQYLDVSRQTLLHAIGIPVSTATRKARARTALSPEESDKVDRVARVVKRALEVFGDEAQARAWLTDPVLTLGGRKPLEMLDSHVGYEIVMDTLGQILYGAPA